MDDFKEYAYQKASQASEEKVKITYQSKIINDIPKEILALKHIPKLHLKLSTKGFSLFSKTFIALEKVFEQLSELTNLVGLDLSENNIEILPNNISKLSNLVWLNCSNNRIKDLPCEIVKLVKLEDIDFSFNQLQEIQYLNSLPKLSQVRLKANNDLKYHQVSELFNQFNNLTIEKYFKLISTLKLKPTDYSSSEPGNYFFNDFTFPDNAKYIPDEIGLCSAQIDSLSLYKPLEYISEEISKLQNLKGLTLIYNNLKQAPFPDVYDKLYSLKNFNLSIYNTDILRLGDTFYSSQIESISIEGGKMASVILDFNKIPLMKNLKEIRIPYLTEKQFEIIKNCPNITSISVNHNFDNKIPCVLDHITHFTGFSNKYFEDNLLKLPNLKSISILGDEIDYLPKSIIQLQNLQRLYIGSHIPLSKELFDSLIIQCKSLIRIELYLKELSGSVIIYDYKSSSKGEVPNKLGSTIYIPYELSSVCLDVLTKLSIQHYNNLPSYIYHVFSFPFATIEQIQLAFKLLIDDYSGFNNPFMSPTDLEYKKIYLFGQSTYFENNQQQREELNKLKVEVFEEYHEDIDYILINNDLNAEQWESAILYNKPIIIEDFFKEFHLKQNETAYLINDNSIELYEQIFRLWQTEEDNIVLILSILDGGGVDRKWLSAILSIYCYSIQIDTINEEVSLLAATIFDKYADSELIGLRKWCENNPNGAYHWVVNNAMVNKFAFSLAWSLMQPSSTNLSLEVDNVLDTQLLKFIQPKKYIGVTISAANLNLISLFESIILLEPKEISIQFQAMYKEWEMPKILFEKLNLETITFQLYYGNYNVELFSVPVFLSSNQTLKNISFIGINKVIGIENLQGICQNVEKIMFNTCNLEEVPKFIEECKSLKELDLRQNLLSTDSLKRIPSHLIEDSNQCYRIPYF